MLEGKELVINTSPLIALVAAMGDLKILLMYQKVWVPLEVCQEISLGGAAQFALQEFESADWLEKQAQPFYIAPILLNTLDKGEAAVIQLAMDRAIQTVCIDEVTGRRIARLNGLSVTGSIGILLRAKREGLSFFMRDAIDQMVAHGIWLSEGVIEFAVTQAGEM